MLKMKLNNKEVKILTEDDIPRIVEMVGKRFTESKKTVELMTKATKEGRAVNLEREKDKEKQLIKALLKEEKL